MTAYSDAVLSDSPNGYWHLNEISNWISSASGGGLMLNVFQTVLVNQAGLVTNHSDGAVRFTASPGGFLETASNVKLDLGDVLTLEAWIKRTSTGDTGLQGIITKQNGAYYMRLNGTSGNIEFLASQVAAICTSSGGAITDTNPHHVVVTKNGATVKIYIDGVDRTGTVTNATLVNNTGNFRIGYDVVGDQALLTVDEVAIYPTALSAARVASHFSVGNAVPGGILANGRQITVSTSPTQILFGSQGTFAVRNAGTASVFLGGSTVTTGNGFELKQTDPPIVLEITGDTLYGVVATATQRVDTLEVD